MTIHLGEFLERAHQAHGNRYEYDTTNYRGAITKIDIICPKHGIFKQIPAYHMAGQGCPRCARKLWHYNQMTTEMFLEKAKKIYEDTYDYSLVKYERSNLKIKVICRTHGVFEVTPNNHLRKMGRCPKCAEVSRADKRRSNTQEFIAKAKKVHGDKYDYSLADYKSVETGIRIICPKHGEFLQIPSVHTAGKGCRACSDDKHRSNTQEFLEKAKKIHGNRYDYSLSEYSTTRSKVKIVCPKHGIFEQTARNHLKGNGCNICLESRGERKINDFLKTHNIKFEREKTFKGCRNRYPLFFDFYIPELNTCIEFDGLQHFVPLDYFGGTPVFERTKKSDAIKNEFCLRNGIRLIRISYKDRDPVVVLKRELKYSSAA